MIKRDDSRSFNLKKKKKLKIAVYSGSLPSTTFIEQLIHAVAIENEVLLFGRGEVRYQSKNIRVHSISNSETRNIFLALVRTLLLMKYPKRLSLLFREIGKLNSFYKKRQAWIRIVPVLLHIPDIFHVQWAKDLASWMFLKELNVKIVLSLRGAHINYSPIANPPLAFMYKTYFPKVDAFHAVSEAIKIEAQKYNAVPDKITVIHSLLPQSTFDLFRLPEKRNSDFLRIISVGRHHWKKGYSIALDSCKILKDRNIPFVYTIVAQGKVPEELLIQRNQLDLVDEVVFEKGISQSELFITMQQSDVLLLPSIEEGIANVVLEAMAIGVPVLSTDCGGMKEVIIHNETGWLVPILDAEAIVEALIEFKETSMESKKEIILNAHTLVKKHFDSKNNTMRFVEFYQSLF